MNLNLEQKISDHEEILREHSNQLKDLRIEIQVMHKEFHDGLTRVDESNRFLREQNTRQSEQNTQILNAVIEQKEDQQQRDHEFRMMNRSNVWKLIILIGGSSSLITYILDHVLNLF